jgi:phosphate transport system protein
MLRGTFERQLSRLEEDVLILGSVVSQALDEAVKALRERNLEAARRLIAGDRAVNEKRYAIEAEALALIATQQPMAGDLRTLAAILEIATELERIGDYAKGISCISLMIGAAPLLKPLLDIPAMAAKTREMLDRALDAFVRRDAALARAIPAEDDVVDNLYNQVYRELMTYVIAEPGNMRQANFMLWAAHNLERAADRVTNICERVIFTVTGEMEEMDMEDAELASPG